MICCRTNPGNTARICRRDAVAELVDRFEQLGRLERIALLGRAQLRLLVLLAGDVGVHH